MKRVLPALLAAALIVPASQARIHGGTPVALVTAESLNELLVVSLPDGKILKRLAMPADPENVEASGSEAVVVSTKAGAVTLLTPNQLRIRKVIHGFGAPHIAAFSPDGKHVYVSDDARGQLAVIDLASGRLVRKMFAGYGAHHMGFSPDGNGLWVALGEHASRISVLDTSNAARPRLTGHVQPRGLAHDLAFSPDGRRVWVTYDDRPEVGIYDAATKRLIRTLRAGSAPQHVAFDPFSHARYAYLTSGDDGTLRIVSLRTLHVVRTVPTSYGSFNLGLSGSLIVIPSLYRGTLIELADGGRVLLRRRIAPVARDAAVYVLP
jgi:DNA-binding beta-propeller fold protein YncE